MDWSRRTLIAIRHGETDWNTIGRLQGQQDVAMNAVGREQARRNGRALAGWLADIGRPPESFSWYASPLGRTRETMELVRAAMGLEPAGYDTDERLKELTFGDWEGEILGELKRKVPDQYRARRRDKWHFVPPNGESYEMLMTRVVDWLAATEGDFVSVTHGGVIRVLWHVLEGRPTGQAAEETVPQGLVYTYRFGVAEWI